MEDLLVKGKEEMLLGPISGKILMDYIGTIDFGEKFHEASGFFTRFSGPYSLILLSSLYGTMKDLIGELKKVKEPDSMIKFFKASKNIFSSDLYGIHLFIGQYLDLPDVVVDYGERSQEIMELYLGITFDISCLLG